jgi:hypothetical protein
VLSSGLLFVVYVLVHEDRILRQAAQRLRELGLEGNEDLVSGRCDVRVRTASHGTIVVPDGKEMDRDELLHRELARLRRFQADRSGPRPMAHSWLADVEAPFGHEVL